MVRVHTNESLVVVDPDSRIFGRILPRNMERPVGTAVVDNSVVPVGVSLREHTLDALAQKALPVENWGHDANKRFLFRGHPFTAKHVWSVQWNYSHQCARVLTHSDLQHGVAREDTCNFIRCPPMNFIPGTVLFLIADRFDFFRIALHAA
jgi:hypothetical protein